MYIRVQFVVLSSDARGARNRDGKREKRELVDSVEKKTCSVSFFLSTLSFRLKFAYTFARILPFCESRESSRKRFALGTRSPTTVIDFPRDALTRAALVREFARVK